MAESIHTLQAEIALLNANTLPRVGPTGDIRQARRVAEEFEAVFLGQVLKPMFATVGTDGRFGGGFGEDMWRSLQVDEYGKAIARTGGIGIADAVLRQILEMQESKQP